MKEYQHAVYIGRFQPFHDGHLAVVKHGLEIAENLIIVIGSVNAAPNIKNPWSFEERKEMIMESLGMEPGAIWVPASHFPDDKHTTQVHVVGVRDWHYNDNGWIAEVQAKTDQFIQYGESVALLGQYKDSSSHYLRFFPQWEFVPIKDVSDHAATHIRERLLRERFMPDWEGKVPERYRGFIFGIIEKLEVSDPVKQYLKEWVLTPEYENLCAEHAFIAKYKSEWDSAPYPPTFNTTDAVVVCSGHVLVVKRKFNPGKGLYALPGGFLNQKERVQAGMLRELKEETGIRVDSLILESSIKDDHVFDYPERSLRGRTITHGFYLKLKDGRLPEVYANDDASNVLWMPLIDVSKNERKFFEDHAHIIHYFTGVS